jgi:hypothetical protein
VILADAAPFHSCRVRRESWGGIELESRLAALEAVVVVVGIPQQHFVPLAAGFFE